MSCPRCDFSNPEGMRFCGGCGAPLALSCPRCGAANRPDFSFCGRCAAPLADPIPPAPDPSAAAAERRQLSVVFCDLVGSTALSERLDPEDLRQLVRAYHEACAAAIDRLGGHIAQYLGDGILAYFGYPQAHEDDARRAVRAGLAILQVIPAVNAQIDPSHHLAVRIGVHTGEVVVGTVGGGGHYEQLALGETPNLASRLQGLAEPGTLVISAETERLVAGYFDTRTLGPHVVKGISRPVEVFLVRGETGAQGRLDVAALAGLTPLVGRRGELAFLLDRWEQVKDGAGQVIVVGGEAGIGKSRLVRALRERIAAEPQIRLELRCSPYLQNSAFAPGIESLERMLGFERVDSAEERLAKLEAAVAVEDQPRLVPLVAALLSLPHPPGYPELELSPEQQRRRTMAAITTWVLDQAQRQPVLMVVEDLHWVDPSTLELLGLLVEQLADARVLLLATARPEAPPPWAARSHVVHLALGRLPRAQAAEIVRHLSRETQLPPPLVEEILARTDGVPFFVEELTKLVLESGMAGDRGAGPAGALRTGIPVTLRDSLMARLDRMGGAKAVAQLGAVLGREFSFELLAAASPLGAEELERELDRLVEAEILQRRGLPPQASYRFTHALIQEGAYQSLLKSTRRAYHREAGRALAERLPDLASIQPELLAHHYTEGGETEQAIAAWKRASRRAQARSANEEAARHLGRALELIAHLPESPERDAQELAALTGLGLVQSVLVGYGAEERGLTLQRQLELSHRLGSNRSIFGALYGLMGFHAVRSEQDRALALAQECVALAERVGDRVYQLLAYKSLGTAHLFRGEFVQARARFERACALHDPVLDRPRRSSTALDPGIEALSFLGRTLWALGYSDAALVHVRRAIALAEEAKHPHSLALALLEGFDVHAHRGEAAAALETAERMLALMREEGFAYLVAFATASRGIALLATGRPHEAVEQFCASRALHAAVGAPMNCYHLICFADTYCGIGDVEAGLAMIQEAVAYMERTNERQLAAMLHRVRGDLLLAQSPREAERCYLQGIEAARAAGEGLGAACCPPSRAAIPLRGAPR